MRSICCSLDIHPWSPRRIYYISMDLVQRSERWQCLILVIWNWPFARRLLRGQKVLGTVTLKAIVHGRSLSDQNKNWVTPSTKSMGKASIPPAVRFPQQQGRAATKFEFQWLKTMITRPDMRLIKTVTVRDVQMRLRGRPVDQQKLENRAFVKIRSTWLWAWKSNTVPFGIQPRHPSSGHCSANGNDFSKLYVGDNISLLWRNSYRQQEDTKMFTRCSCVKVTMHYIRKSRSDDQRRL